MEIPTTKGFKDLTGMQFGRLQVTSYGGKGRPDRPKTPNHLWECRCECGTSKTFIGNNLKKGTTVSCGCFHKEATSKARLIDLTNRRFGRLLVIGRGKTVKGQPYWNCVCDCDETSEVAGNSLLHGKSKSCGCRQGGYIHGLCRNKKEYKKHLLSDPIRRLRHVVGNTVRDAIRYRNGTKKGSTFDKLPYTVEELKQHLESLWEPWMNWDNYGGKSNDPRMTWHIDHIIPQSKFKFTSLDDPLFLECWSLRNLRPLEKIANIKKGKKDA